MYAPSQRPNLKSTPGSEMSWLWIVIFFNSSTIGFFDQGKRKQEQKDRGQSSSDHVGRKGSNGKKKKKKVRRNKATPHQQSMLFLIDSHCPKRCRE